MKPRVLVAQRQTNVASTPIPSRSVYARILEPLEFLRDQGKIELAVEDESKIPFEFKGVDVLIFSKHSSQQSLDLSEAARSQKVRVIYDIDDFLPAFPAYSGGQDISRRISRLQEHISRATVVTTATSILKKNIDPFFHANVTIVRNGINVERHRKEKQYQDEPKLVFTNADQLKVDKFKSGLFEAVNETLQLFPSLEFDIISDPNEQIKNFSRCRDLGVISWFEHKRVLASHAYNISITPLGGIEDKDALLFNSCKSPIKYLEYGALEIAGVYSKSPIYEETIEHGQTGLLVENDASTWKDALKELVLNKDLRAKIAKNALNDVRQNHHVRDASEDWLKVIQS